MDWRRREDLWFGLALLRPISGSENEGQGGAYVSFFVAAPAIAPALDSLIARVAEGGWRLTSLEQMKRACDYFGDDADGDEEELPEYEEMAATAQATGLVLGAYHIFPSTEQMSS